jgi:hypothetical protein
MNSNASWEQTKKYLNLGHPFICLFIMSKLVLGAYHGEHAMLRVGNIEIKLKIPSLQGAQHQKCKQ